MRADEDERPRVGETGRYLGVRPSVDILVDADGLVEPETGGMSAVPSPMTNLAPHRLPREHGGTGGDPVFELDTDNLPDELRHRPDPSNPGEHVFIEPSRRMAFEEYERAVHATRVLWRIVR